MMKTLFVSFSCQSDNSGLEYFPKPIGRHRSGLGFVFSDSGTSEVAYMFCGVNSFSSFIQYFLSTVNLLSVEKHVRNELKDTKVPTVPAIRTGQDRNLFCRFWSGRLGNPKATFYYIHFKFVCCLS